MSNSQVMRTVGVAPAHAGRAGDWQQWAPYAAVAWSLLYAALGIYWVAGGSGFPYSPELATDPLGPLLGRLGPGAAWAVVMLAGLPAAALGVAILPASLRSGGGRRLRPIFIAAGAVVTGVLLLFMADLTLLESLGYIPYTLFLFLTGGDASRYMMLLAQSTVAHQLFCLTGGFLWLAATVCYARRSGDACLYCGRTDGPQGWQSPEQAARWGRIATYTAMAVPIFYAATRYAWALGIPLGMSEAYLRQGQERGTWIAGLFLANFGLVGALIMLGLVQRWGERFPRWMIGLAGRRVPIGLAVVPSALVSVVLVVGGIAIWSALPQMAAALASTGVTGSDIPVNLAFQVGPTLLFPVWGVALAVAALGYYFRRREACSVCGRGA